MFMSDGNASAKIFYFTAAYIFLIFGYSLGAGFFHQVQLWSLGLALLFLLLPFFKTKIVKPNFNFNVYHFLLLANLAGFTLFYFFDNGIYVSTKGIFNNIVLLKFIALLLFFFYLVNFQLKGANIFSLVVKHLSKYKFIYLVFLAVALRLLVVYGSPEPKIDVFWVLTGGSQAVLQGNNPYSQEFNNVYTAEDCLLNYGTSDCDNDNYTYLPLTIIISTVFYSIFGDVRFAQIFATLGMALLVYLLTKKNSGNTPEIPQLASLLILYLPSSLFVLEQGWVDSVSLFFLYLFVFLTYQGYKYAPYLVLGGMMAVKQLSWVILGFILRLKKLSVAGYMLTVSVFLAIIGPFVIWSFLDFFDDTIWHHVTYQPSLFSLSLNTVARVNFGTNIPLVVVLVALVSLFVFLMIKTPRDISGVVHSSLVFLLSLFILKQGFPNYYFSIALGIILLIALEICNLHKKSNEN